MDPSFAVAGPADSEPTVKRNNFRLPQVAANILKDYFDRSPYLSPPDKEGLLSQIRAIEGCDHYTGRQLTYWFKTARVKSGVTKATVQKDMIPVVADLLFPSIKTKIHAQLLVLWSHNPNPNPDIIALWAERLTKKAKGRVVALDDVTAWVRHQQALDSSQTPSSSYRPLTPPESTSPEPLGPAYGSAMELDSQIVPEWEILAQSDPSTSTTTPRELDIDEMDIDLPPPPAIPVVKAPRVQPNPVPHHALPLPPPAPAPPKPTPISDAIQRISLLIIPPPSTSPTAAGPQSASRSPPPQSLFEAARRLSPFTDAAQRFLNLLEGGKLEALGWPKSSPLNGDDPFAAPV
ncbi:hypothetical protein FIBSPDRAFT_1049733 [Athelia psychrophila]|uniref:Homeobox domain-containing protein n=1 Tax=Athelia psychrophila TaxID=1759441 RepID=A0A166BVZ4_9AGAM|nr:hypothetical protein FIBSPDRAFT_1049733 [Fibularhizoctonia sp. CBS 109695]